MRMPFADPVDSSTGRLPRAQRSYAVPESRALEECGCGLVPARWIGEVRDLNRVGFSKPQHKAAGLAADVRIASPFLPVPGDRIGDGATASSADRMGAKRGHRARSAVMRCPRAERLKSAGVALSQPDG